MAKYLVQLIITGAQVLGRAFTRAVKQEIQSSQEAAQRLGQQSQAKDFAANAQMGLTVDEAKRILDVTNLDAEEIQKRYQFLYGANNDKNGGNLYIRSKIYRAKERLEFELKKSNE